MRQLKLTPLKDKLTPAEFAAYEAEQAEALPLLRSLSATHPSGLDAELEESWFCYIVSIATLYRGQGASWAELLTAGHTAFIECLVRYAERPGEFNRWASWWIRQGIAMTLPGKGVLEEQ